MPLTSKQIDRIRQAVVKEGHLEIVFCALPVHEAREVREAFTDWVKEVVPDLETAYQANWVSRPYGEMIWLEWHCKRK
jgi:hypothetical protein